MYWLLDRIFYVTQPEANDPARRPDTGDDPFAHPPIDGADADIEERCDIFGGAELLRLGLHGQYLQ